MPTPFTLRTLIEIAATIGVAGSLSFHFLALLALRAFLRERRSQSNLTNPPLPPISILKPLKGVDPAIWESFCSHCEQDYPQFQLLFGVSDASDPALAIVRQLQSKYPNIPIDVVVCDRLLGPNVKVSNLVQMLPHARHDILLVNDSDIRIPSGYLREVVAPFADDSVGLVTCLYRGIAGPSLGSRIEALSVNTDFIPGVLVARFLERGLHFGLGSTLAFRRRELEAIGGFEPLLDYLADDYELGRRIAASGKRVVLSSAIVETFLPAYTLPQFFRHQLRWSRTIRDARRWGYAGLLFTFGLPWALLLLFSVQGSVHGQSVRGQAWAWMLFALTLIARFTVARTAAVEIMNDRQLVRDLPWLILRDLLAPLLWAAGFMGNRVHWRGELFDLKDGRLTRLRTASPGWKK